jgi:hypothetical protein
MKEVGFKINYKLKEKGVLFKINFVFFFIIIFFNFII